MPTIFKFPKKSLEQGKVSPRAKELFAKHKDKSKIVVKVPR